MLWRALRGALALACLERRVCVFAAGWGALRGALACSAGWGALTCTHLVRRECHQLASWSSRLARGSWPCLQRGACSDVVAVMRCTGGGVLFPFHLFFILLFFFFFNFIIIIIFGIFVIFV